MILKGKLSFKGRIFHLSGNYHAPQKTLPTGKKFDPNYLLINVPDLSIILILEICPTPVERSSNTGALAGLFGKSPENDSKIVLFPAGKHLQQLVRVPPGKIWPQISCAAPSDKGRLYLSEHLSQQTTKTRKSSVQKVCRDRSRIICPSLIVPKHRKTSVLGAFVPLKRGVSEL